MSQNTLSAVDTAWFRIDEPTNTADIVALITFAEPVELARVQEVVAREFGRFPEFRSRVVDPGGVHLPFFEAVERFDHHEHIVETRLESASRDELEAFVSDVLTQDLPRDQPLWKMWVVQNVVGGSALVVKVHHCLGDGFALIGVLLTLCDEPPLPRQVEASDQARPSLGAQLWEGLAHPLRHREQIAETARTTAKFARSLGDLVVMSFDPATSLRAELSGVRRAAWSHGLELARFKAIARATGGTINDILLTVLAGALRDVLLEAGDDLDEATIRAIIPVNLRPLEDVGKELGNKFGLVFLDLPVGEPDGLERRTRVRRSMDELKQSPQALVGFGLLGAFGLGPDVVEHIASDIFTRKASLVVTNVPGPRERLHLAGTEIDHIMFWVPHPAHLGLGVSLLSYAGEVRIGVRADRAVMPNPQVLVDAFEAELGSLEVQVGDVSV